MLSVQNISKVYDKRGIAGLHGVTFSLGEGEIGTLMGPNGSGKTSLMKILAQELPLETGSFTAEGDIVLFKPEDCPTQGNVQRFLMSSVTITQDEDKKLQLVRDLAGILEFTFQLRQDLADLSAGQKQKVLLSSALINHPKLLLLDEPFGHLDPYTRKVILKDLFSFLRQQGVSALWVTHDLPEALLFSDKLGVLNFGKLEQWGSPEEHSRSPKNLFVAQFMGYENFLPIKRKSASTWETPWGDLVATSTLLADEAYLVIPNRSWLLSNDKTHPFKIEERDLMAQGIRLRGSLRERNYVVELPFSYPKDFSLTPKWEECFLLPL